MIARRHERALPRLEQFVRQPLLDHVPLTDLKHLSDHVALPA